MRILKELIITMDSFNEKIWRFIAKALRFIGGGGCLVVLISFMSLIAYYSITRPHVPQHNYNWTVQLRWSFNYPSYGTAGENAFLIHLQSSFFIFFVLLLISEFIRKK
jgi:hypothetical protein